LAKDRQDYEDHQDSLSGRNGGTLLAMETLRNAGSSRGAEASKGEERMSVFWRVFGGTLLSIGALIVITICNQFNSALTDLRKEMNQLYEARADLLRKEEFSNRMNSVWNAIKDLQSMNHTLPTLNEKAKTLDQSIERQSRNAEEDRKEFARKLEEQRRASDDERKELLRKMEEQRKAGEDERKELHRELNALKERLAKVEGRKAPNTAKN